MGRRMGHSNVSRTGELRLGSLVAGKLGGWKAGWLESWVSRRVLCRGRVSSWLSQAAKNLNTLKLVN